MPNKDNKDPEERRELMADELESRVLFSAAPVDMPDQVAHEAPAIASPAFESIDALVEAGGASLPLETYFANEGYTTEISIDNSENYSDAPRLTEQSYRSVYDNENTYGLEEIRSSLEDLVVLKSF